MEAEQDFVASETQREAEQKKVSRGAEDLRAAADLVLQELSMEIAKSMAKSSMEGHIQSAKFLYELANENQKLGPVETEQPCLADDLANEPEWTGDPIEETSEEAVKSGESES